MKPAVPHAIWLSVVLGLAYFAAACATGPTLIRETPDGGVVAYTIASGHDVLTAPGRPEALQIIRRKCPHGSRIVREGQLATIHAKVDKTWGDQVTGEKRWALQFQCT